MKSLEYPKLRPKFQQQIVREVVRKRIRRDIAVSLNPYSEERMLEKCLEAELHEISAGAEGVVRSRQRRQVLQRSGGDVYEWQRRDTASGNNAKVHNQALTE